MAVEGRGGGSIAVKAGGKGDVSLTCRWGPGQTFLIQDFTVKQAGGKETIAANQKRPFAGDHRDNEDGIKPKLHHREWVVSVECTEAIKEEIANGWYADGADVVYTAAGGSGAGTIEAAVESNAWAIGVDSDQYLTATPDQQKHILTSMLKRVDTSVFDTVKQFKEGTLKGGFATHDLKSDGVGYSTSGGYLDDVKDKLEAIKADIISGKITVPTAP